MGTKWEQNRKVRQEPEQNGNKNRKLVTRMGTEPERTPKWDKNGNKAGKEPQSGTRMGTMWEQEPQSGTAPGTEQEKEPQDVARIGTQ